MPANPKGNQLVSAIRRVHEANPSWTSYEIGPIFGVTPDYIRVLAAGADIPLPKRKVGCKLGSKRKPYVKGQCRRLITIHNGRACLVENAIEEDA